MKLVANIQLKPTPRQASALLETLERCSAACNWLSEVGQREGKTRQFDLHKIAYLEARKKFDLGAQIMVRCIAKVADAYKAGRPETPHLFRRYSAQPYDERIFRILYDDRVNIWTVEGRQKIPFVCGERQRKLLEFQKGEVDLMLVRGKWYIAAACDIPDPEEMGIEGVLGVDFGVVNIAYDSLGKAYSGKGVDIVRRTLSRRRAGLQKRGTKAAKRRLKKLSGREARFRKHVNHCISKDIVARAKRSRLAVALEDLRGIGGRVKARKAQRNRLHSWSFHQLRHFVSYKAKRSGVPLFVVNPKNTSRACPECRHTDKANRRTQAVFFCKSCGHTGPADHIAARNIAFLAGDAKVTRP